jgi:hypothetical protein
MIAFTKIASRIFGSILVMTALNPAVDAQAAGSITLANSVFTRVQVFPDGTSVPLVFGVFWGTNQSELILAPRLATNGVGGLIMFPNPYVIPGTEAGQTVYLRIRAWYAPYGTNWMAARENGAYFGETDTRLVLLAAEAGPGTVIWQSPSGTSSSRFYPLQINAPLTPAAVISFGILPRTVVIDEGEAGVVEMPLTLYRTPTSGQLDFNTSVLLQTFDLTALAGQDYVGTNFAVIFGPGETSRQIRLYITGGPGVEPEEQFALRFANMGTVNQDTLTFTIRPARLTAVRPEADRVVVSFPTTSHQRYAVESSTDLLAWSLVPGAEEMAGTGSTVEAIDTTPDCCGHRFYRLALLP